MFHLSLRSDTDVSLVATFWYRCSTCLYVLTQMFHLSLRSDTDVSLVATFWHRCFTCLYVLTQMFHLSPISRAHVFSPVTTMSHMLLYLLPRTGTHLVSRHYARDPSGKMYPPEKKYILYCQPHFLLECKAMHSVKSAPKFKKYQEFTYAVYGHMFLWNIGTNIPAYRSHKHSHSTTLISINTINPYNWNSRVPLIVTENIQDSIA